MPALRRNLYSINLNPSHRLRYRKTKPSHRRKRSLIRPAAEGHQQPKTPEQLLEELKQMQRQQQQQPPGQVPPQPEQPQQEQPQAQQPDNPQAPQMMDTPIPQ